jgi:hypothetical protein
MLLLSMFIDETTSIDKVTACWDTIAAWRDQLAIWQGPSSMAGRYVAMLARWHAVWRSGKHAKPSSRDLANSVNTEVAVTLEEFWGAARDEGQAIDLAALLAEPSPESVPADH